MKKTTMKSLLVAGLLAVGATGVWAEVTSIYERGTTTAWSSTDISEDEWNGSDGTLEITDLGLKYTSPNNGGGMYTKAISTKNNSKITVNATWYVGGSTGRAGNHNILQLGSLQFRAYGQDQYGGLYDVSGTDAVEIKRMGGKDDVRTDGAWVISLTIDKAKGKISYTVDLPSSDDVSGETTLASVSFNNIGIGFTRGGRTNTSNSTLSAIEILEEMQTLTTASYTVKYMDENNAEIKEADNTRSGVVGDTPVLSATDKESFKSTDGTKKYIYSSDDAANQVIASNGSTIVTVYFSTANKYEYTLKAVDEDNNELDILATGSAFEDESVRVYYTKAFEKDGIWYMTNGNTSYPTYGIDFTEAGTKTVTYKISDINYFIECEDMNKSTNWAATGSYADRYSNGKVGRFSKGASAYTNSLEGGVYTLTLWGRNQASSSEANVGVYVRDAENNETRFETQFDNWGTGVQAIKSIEGITIPEGGAIVLKNENTEYNSNLEMDYIYLVKTADLTPTNVSIAVSTAGYKTYCSEYALDFSNLDVKAYTAQLNGTEVTFTNVNTVPANTGILLKGTADTYEVPVVAEASAIDNNALIGVLEDTEVPAGSFVLMNGNDGIGFYKTNNPFTVGANTAYLPALSSNGIIRLNFTEDIATGIQAISTTTTYNRVYNLQGQRIMQPQKGLYILNGRKVVMK